MLSTPEYGWTYFQLGKESSYRMSFLTDVAVEWLTQAIHGLKTMDVFSVHGFSEPGRVICTVSYWSCYIIFEDDGPAPICEGVDHLHVNMLEFCKKLYEDIDRDLDSWVRWDEEDPDDEEQPLRASGGAEAPAAELDEALREREKRLRGLLDELKTLIDEHESDFEDGCFF